MEKSELVQITRQRKIAEEDFGAMINAIYEQIWQNLLPPQILTDDLTSVRANNVVTPPDAPVPDCQSCGACCASLPSVGVRPAEPLSEEDCWDVILKSETDEIVIDPGGEAARLVHGGVGGAGRMAGQALEIAEAHRLHEELQVVE